MNHQARELLRKELGRSPREDEMAALIAKSYTEDIELNPALGVKEAVTFLRQRDKRRGEPLPPASTVRRMALSFSAYWAISGNLRVQEFRREVLCGEVLDGDDWGSQAKRFFAAYDERVGATRDGERYTKSKAETSECLAIVLTKLVSTLGPSEIGELANRLPDVARSLARAFMPRSAEAWGVSLAEEISQRWPLRPGQALQTIFCNTVPLIAETWVSFEDSPVPWGKRLRIDVDPATPPSEVVRAYNDARAATAGKRFRSMSAKHAWLAVAFENLDDIEASEGSLGSLTSDAQLTMWNERYPAWAYTRGSQFRRDGRAAQRAMFHPVYNPIEETPYFYDES